MARLSPIFVLCVLAACGPGTDYTQANKTLSTATDGAARSYILDTNSFTYLVRSVRVNDGGILELRMKDCYHGGMTTADPNLCVKASNDYDVAWDVDPKHLDLKKSRIVGSSLNPGKEHFVQDLQMMVTDKASFGYALTLRCQTSHDICFLHPGKDASTGGVEYIIPCHDETACVQVAAILAEMSDTSLPDTLIASPSPNPSMYGAPPPQGTNPQNRSSDHRRKFEGRPASDQH